MYLFLLRRLAQTIISLGVIAGFVFVMGRATGDPVALLLPVDAPDEAVEQLRRSLGLDRTYVEQFWHYVTHLARGDLGTSITTRRPVSELIWTGIPASAQLGMASVLLAFLVGIPLGVVASIRRGTVFDSIANVIAGIGQATPNFWLGLILIYVFVAELNVVPVGGAGSWKHFLLPTVTLGSYFTAALTRLVRSSMLEFLDSEFVKLARIKGVPEAKVIWVHCLRNALLPVVSYGGVMTATLVTGSIVTETVFAWPGLGRLLVDAIQLRDFPVVQGVVIVTAIVVIMINSFVDILYAYLDPRIRIN